MDTTAMTSDTKKAGLTSSSATAAMEQFLLLAKSCHGLSAVQLIRQMLESPQMYVFGEFLDLPNIRELSSNCELKPWYDLLVIFSYGTYKDYVKERTTLPALSEPMATKLRHLTIVSLATKRKHIPYDMLLSELDMKNLRQLEDLIIDVIYANVVVGKMDQLHSRLEVEQTIGRDIKREQLSTMTNILNEWLRNCDNVLSNIEQQMSNASQLKEDNHRLKTQIEQQVNNIKKTIKTQDMEEAMSTDVVNSSPRDHPRDQLDKMKRNAQGKGKGLRGSGGKFWKRDNN